MLEESNDIVEAVAVFLGAEVVSDLYVNHKKGVEEE